MSATSTIPITITPEATEYVARLGYEREFKEILEHTLQTIPHIRRLEVFVDHDIYGEGIPKVFIQPVVEPGSTNPTEVSYTWHWSHWKVRRYPPQVFQHFLLMPLEDE